MTAIRALQEVAGAPRVRKKVQSKLTELADSWDRLAAGSGSPLHHYAWVSACAETFAAATELQVVVVGTPPVAIAPLIMRRSRFLRLELLGARELHEPMDLVYKNPAEVTALALAGAVAQLGLPLFLERVPAESSTVSALKQAWCGRGVVICRPALGCPWIELDCRWGEPEPPLGARRRSDLRRARRHAEKIGPVSCQILSPAPNELDALLADAFRVEAASWKGRRGTALASDPARGAFYRRYAAAACREGILRLCFLRIGGRIAAVEFAVESEERFWLLKMGYDEAFARCSPGQLLLGETVREAAKRGLRSFEFLGFPEPWIRAWTEQVRPCLSIWAYPAGPSAMACLAADIAQAGWRKLERFLGSRR